MANQIAAFMPCGHLMVILNDVHNDQIISISSHHLTCKGPLLQKKSLANLCIINTYTAHLPYCLIKLHKPQKSP